MFCLQEFEDEVLRYGNKNSFSDIGGGDEILSRSNRIRLAVRSRYSMKGFLASFQAGNFL